MNAALTGVEVVSLGWFQKLSSSLLLGVSLTRRLWRYHQVPLWAGPRFSVLVLSYIFFCSLPAGVKAWRGGLKITQIKAHYLWLRITGDLLTYPTGLVPGELRLNVQPGRRYWALLHPALHLQTLAIAGPAVGRCRPLSSAFVYSQVEEVRVRVGGQLFATGNGGSRHGQHKNL